MELTGVAGLEITVSKTFCRSKKFFTITTEIHARSLANFYCPYADVHINLKIHVTRQRARAGNSTICYRKKQIDVSFLMRLSCY